MAELLANWLNSEVQLTKEITNFEDDFSSGYLFGELLWKFNQQADFEQFSKKDAISHKLQNFEKLEPTLRNLKIKFDSQMVDKIMKKERGHALRLLYQLKKVLERVYAPTDIAVLTKTGKFGDNQPALKIPQQKEKYDSVNHEFFKQRLQMLNKPQKVLNMEAHLKKFEDERKRQERDAIEHTQMLKEADAKAKQQMRQEQIHKLQRNAGFMEEWLQKGVQDWKKNQSSKREREQRQLEFDYKQAQKYNKIANDKLEASNREVHEGIEQFENTLRQNGVNPRVTRDAAERAMSESLKQTTTAEQNKKNATVNRMAASINNSEMMTKTGAFTLTSTGLKSRSKKTVDDRMRKTRDKRRRQLIAEQEKYMVENDRVIREERVVESMKHKSKQEAELDYEVWRTQECKNIIVENRKLREAKYERRRELDTQNAVAKEDHMLKAMQDQLTRCIDENIERHEHLQGYEVEQKTKNRTDFCSTLVDAIFDIADEAYKHQQQKDSSDIDPRNWHEWTQLFIQSMPVSGTLDKLTNYVTEDQFLEAPKNDENKEQEADQQNEDGEQDQAKADTRPPLSCEANDKLDELELVDYLQNKGQWTTSLITDNKPDLEAMINAPADSAPTGKGKAAPAKGGNAAADVHFEEGDFDIDDQPANNFLLGDALEEIIKLNYEAKAKERQPRVPHYLDLKLALVGYAFSGKSTQAQVIKEKYGLDVYNMEELVKEAIELYEQNPEPFVDESKQQEEEAKEAEEQQQNQEDAAQEQAENQENVEENKEENAEENKAEEEAKEPEQEKVLRNPRELEEEEGNKQEEPECSDSEVSEEEEDNGVYLKEEFRLLGKQIKELLLDGEEIPDQLYVNIFVTKIKLVYEFKSKKQIQQERKQQARDMFELQKELDDIKEKLDCKDPAPKKKEASKLQARQQEIIDQLNEIKKQSSQGWVLVDFPCNFAQAKLMEEALSGYKPNVEQDPVDREAEMNDAYLIVQPTAKEDPPQMLIPSGLDAVLWFSCPNIECIRRADGRRIDREQDNKEFHIQDNIPPTDDAPLCERLEHIDQENQPSGLLMDQFKAFDQTTKGMQNWLTQFGVEDTNRKLVLSIDASQNKEAVSNQIFYYINSILTDKNDEVSQKRNQYFLSVKRKHDEAIRKQKEEEEKQKQLENEDENQEEQQPATDNVTTQGKSTSQLAPDNASQRASALEIDGQNAALPPRDNIDNDFRPIIMQMWKDLASNYKSQMRKVFRNLRMNREQIRAKQMTVQQTFLCFLNRLDNKQEILDEFVKSFNEFSDQYPDLREDEQTKEELHQRVDVLSDELWEIVEERKEQAIEERKKQMESGNVETTLAYLTTCAQELMQAELDKFKNSVQILHDYYHAIEEKLIPEPPTQNVAELQFEGDEAPQIESIADGADPNVIQSYSYPRLEKLFEKAIKSQVVPDVSQQVVAAVDPKKGGKNDKKKGGAQQEEEKPVEDSIYVKEMKEAIKVEKSILRFRLVQIRNWALICLKDARQQSLDLYKKLEDWIFVASKAEMDAVEKMCMVVKTAIEDQTKIQDQLLVKFMDFTINEKILNFIDPPPEKHLPLEEAWTDRFNITQLNVIVKEFNVIQSSSEVDGLLKNDVVIDLLTRKLMNSRNFGGSSALPTEWNSLNEQSLIAMVRNLDSDNTGYINWKRLVTYMILLHTPILSEQKDIDQFMAIPNDQGYATLEDFEKAPMWLDSTEISRDREYSHPFPRVQHVKQLLFSVHQEDKKVELSKLLEVLKLHTKHQKYQEVLFAQITQ